MVALHVCAVRFRFFVLLTVLLFIAAEVTHGAEFYVDPGGDNNSVGSMAMPWKTLQHAADRVGPGDRVTVQPGTYVGFHLTTSGMPGSPIEFQAQAGVLVSQRNATTPDGINLEGASYVTIDGFGVTGMPRAGVRAVLGQFVTVRNVRTTENFKWGIFTGFVDDVLIENNETSGSEDEHGIYVSNSGDRPVIRNNVIWGNHSNGIHMNGDLSQGGDGVISDALVSGNVIYDNGLGGGSGINMDGVQNSRVENNLIYNTHASGISLFQIDGGEPSTGNVVVNNTIHVAADGRWALNIKNASTGNTALNNILLNEHSFKGAIDISADSLSGFSSDYNAVISRFTANDAGSVLSLAQWQAFSGGDAHSLVATPDTLFSDWSTGDYDLLLNTPAVDAGTSTLAPLVDLEGRPRPVGAGFDIGAYELSLLSADFDFDGDVDGADFLKWQRGETLDPFSLTDLADWQNDYGAPGSLSSVSTAVPEPTTGLCLTIALLLAPRRRASRR